MRSALPALTAFLSLSLLGALCLFSLPARADIGPKPSMTFQIILTPSEGTPPSLETLQLLVCEKADCSDAHPLPVLGPQHLVCKTPDDCYAIAYGFPPYARLSLTTKGGKRLLSNIFSKQTFHAAYDVRIETNALSVKESK